MRRKLYQNGHFPYSSLDLKKEFFLKVSMLYELAPKDSFDLELISKFLVHFEKTVWKKKSNF